LRRVSAIAQKPQLALAEAIGTRTRLPLDDVVDLEDLRWSGKLDAALVEDRHQARTERLELLLRVPDLANPEAA
jgi:hypothetical protein